MSGFRCREQGAKARRHQGKLHEQRGLQAENRREGVAIAMLQPHAHAEGSPRAGRECNDQHGGQKTQPEGK